MGSDIVEIILRHPEDPAGAGVDAAFDAAVAAGTFAGLRLAPQPGVVSHLAGRIDEDDATTIELPGEASLTVSPASARPAAGALVPVIAMALATERAAIHRIAATAPGGWSELSCFRY